MSESTIFALVLLGVGVVMIFIGVVGVYRNRNSGVKEKDEDAYLSTPPHNAFKDTTSGGVIDKMRMDKDLQEKTRQAIEKRKQQP